MKYIITILLVLIYTLNADQGTIDTVYSFIPGKGSIKGSEPEYYPQNIFGLPSKDASLKVPENGADEILSIGLGGEITVGFKNKRLMDVEGADFTIFENAFETVSGDGIFAEPAQISVSNDGINFVAFEIDLSTLQNCAGKTPVIGSENPFSDASGGDSYDISTLGFTYITHIRIKDTSLIAADLPKESIYYNPKSLLTGFDLDAVTARELRPLEVSVREKEYTFEYDEIEIYDIRGKKLGRYPELHEAVLSENCMYFLIYYFDGTAVKTGKVVI